MQFLIASFRDSGRATCRVARRSYSFRAPAGKIDVTKTTDAASIPPLRRPLGVPDVPTTKVKTLSDRSADFMSQEKQLERMHHLCVHTFYSGNRSHANGLMWVQGKGGVILL
jgi:hypothetical protein